MKRYIFIAGAPGSKWSSVAKNVYSSEDIDRSDYTEARTYYHDASGTRQLMHLGAYWDPGMEFGSWFDQLNTRSKQQCEEEFDRPFSGSGVRIIKSHVFAHHLDFLRENWPDAPIVLVHRSDDSCLGWWVKCGHFDITYPLYHDYYRNLREMAGIIAQQNADILKAWWRHGSRGVVNDNWELARDLGIQRPPGDIFSYAQNDIRVKVI